jgi:hypothetical protein
MGGNMGGGFNNRNNFNAMGGGGFQGGAGPNNMMGGFQGGPMGGGMQNYGFNNRGNMMGGMRGGPAGMRGGRGGNNMGGPNMMGMPGMNPMGGMAMNPMGGGMNPMMGGMGGNMGMQGEFASRSLSVRTPDRSLLILCFPGRTRLPGPEPRLQPGVLQPKSSWRRCVVESARRETQSARVKKLLQKT